MSETVGQSGTGEGKTVREAIMSDTPDERARRLAEIAERESKATKGPWHVDDTPDDTVPQFIYDAKGRGVADTGSNRRPAPEQIINAEFIAHARADIPYLLEEVKRLSAAVQAERESCCTDVCIGCADVETWGKAVFVGGFWVHVKPEPPHHTYPCTARTIRERGSRNEMGEG